MRHLSLLCLPLLAPLMANAQARTPIFPLDQNPLAILQPAQANRPFSVVGQRGAILGQQDGTFELWSLPVKVLDHARLTAKLEGYEADIDLNQHASQIEVRPDHTTITYAHAAITVKQHMFIPRSAQNGVATAIVLFEIHAIRPATVTLSFSPAMERQWPAPNFGRPNAGWTSVEDTGIYTLSTDNPSFFGMVAMPATRGPLRPYQERAQTLPLEFNLSYDPAKDDHRFYPLVAAVTGADGKAGATQDQLQQQILAASANIPDLYRSTADFFNRFFDTRLTAETPDPELNAALRWAEVSIEQARVSSSIGSGLAGGWYTSGDSARPGFGWFFGRDTLWTLYGVNSYGDFQLSREAMDFLLTHQREDGKMMHEVSQTAELVDWVHLPYLYAAADSTPLFVMQMADYVRSSGDTAYLRAHWDNVKRAYAFTRAHTTHGVFDNSQGTGWVEEWLPHMPHQEIYLAALDQQSADSMAHLAKLMGDTQLSSEASQQAATIREYLAKYRSPEGTYSFSNNPDGFDTRLTVFPSVAWWSGSLTLPDADPTFDAWASSRIATDWGTRSLIEGAPDFDPMSYHHGSVWPLYTGWVSLAEYRAHRPQAGYANLMQNARLTWLQDPGAVTEVLSGAFYQPMGRSSSHQLWSSAMVLAPAIRGLFGIEADVLNHRLRVDPQLPASWDHASLHNVPYGDARLDVTLRREGQNLTAEVTSPQPLKLCLQRSFSNTPCSSTESTVHRLQIPLPAVEVGLDPSTPQPGDRTQQVKFIHQSYSGHSLQLKLEVMAGTTGHIYVRTNLLSHNSKSDLKIEGGERDPKDPQQILVHGGTGTGYSEKTVSIRW
jgi:hypothetical protein